MIVVLWDTKSEALESILLRSQLNCAELIEYLEVERVKELAEIESRVTGKRKEGERL